MVDRIHEFRESLRAPMYANAYALVANQIVSAGLGLVYWWLATHLYTKGTVGASQAVISTLLLISGIAQLGLGGGMTRFLPRAGVDTRRLILLAYGTVVATSALLGIAFIAFGGMLGLGGLLGSGPNLGLWLVLAAVLWSIFRLQDQVLIGLRHAKWVLIENTIYNVAKLALIFLGATLLGRAGIVGSWFLPTPIVIVLVTLLIFGVYTRKDRLVPAPDAAQSLTIREVAATSAGDHVGSLVAEAGSRLLPLLIVATLGAVTNASFAIAWLVSSMLPLLAGGMTDSFTAEAAGDRANIGQYSRDIMRHMALLIIPASAVIGLGAPIILTVFGKSYSSEGTVLLRWLCLSSPLVVFNGWYLAYARVMGRIKQVVWVQVIGAALLLGLSYLLLRPLGISGVGIAMIASQAVLAIIGLLDSRGVLLEPPLARADAVADAADHMPPSALTGAIFVSPHLDDAALSCGAGISRLVHAGVAVTVVTIFTADQSSGEQFSPLARRSHASWGVGDHPMSARRGEDLAAAKVLGVKTEHLGLADAMYRHTQSGEAVYRHLLSAPVSDEVDTLLPQLVATLRDSALTTTSWSRVFCPTGIGGHPDHVLTRRAVEQIVDAEMIVYYDEYPYSARPGVAAISAGDVDGLPARILPVTAEELRTRIEAIGCYRSQLRGLFPSVGERLREVGSAHLPIVGALLVRSPDAEASRVRMATRVGRDMARAGGERYRWPESTPSPFPSD